MANLATTLGDVLVNTKGGKFVSLRRVNLCVEPDETAREHFEKVERKLLVASEVEARLQSCLKTSQRGSSFLKLKLNWDRVRFFLGRRGSATRGNASRPRRRARLTDGRPVGAAVPTQRALTRAGQFYYQLVGQAVRRGAAAPSDYVLLRSGVKKLVRTLAPDSNYHLTKLGKAFWDKYTEWLAHTPVRIRGQNDGLSEAQAARNVKQAALSKLGVDDDGAFSTLLELSGEQYLLDNSREWTLSFQTTQAVDDRVVVEISLRQVLGALSQVSYQLWKGDEILESAFERQWDKLCVPRQLAELLKLPLTEVLSDFDTICERGWQERGVSLKDIRKFCVWRGAPMFFVNCRGQLMGDQPVEKEARAVAFTAWDGYRAERRDSTAPEFARWLEWDGQLRAGYFWTRDLRKAQGGFALGGPLPQGGHEEPARVEGPGDADCVINELPEEAADLQAWTQRLGLKYRGQREQILAAQGGLRKLCGAFVGLGTCEFDHVVPVHQAFRGQIQELQEQA
ncbi:pfh1 [Symbiodinium pilosum]|uniref:Pfh1 protein n=1 Tax=Symbiodinium pilosum TaxID=2952 RepID=A0A812RY20_SYMPI|nr:pfh1 [Symbiodinium pilosum]